MKDRDQLREQQRDVLLALREKERLTNKVVLREAKRTDNPLHKHSAFCWDATEAMERHNLNAARKVLQEFKSDLVVRHGRAVAMDDALGVQKGRSLSLREFWSIRPEAELATAPDEDKAHEEDEVPPQNLPRDYVTLDELQDDRALKVKAAATFFREFRGCRDQCYFFEDLDADFGVIAKAIDRISGRLEAGKFAEEEVKLDVPLPLTERRKRPPTPGEAGAAFAAIPA